MKQQDQTRETVEQQSPSSQALRLLVFAGAALPAVFLICEYVLKPLWHLLVAR